jgi:hypothetical protein
MKDSIYTIILAVVIVFLVGAIGFTYVGKNQGVSVNVTSGPQGNPSTSDSTVGGLSTRSGDVVLTKVLDYDDITTTGVAITNPVTGEFYIENLVIETGKNNIASGTLFQIFTTNSLYGTSTAVYSMGVSSMSAASVFDLNSPTSRASSTQRAVLSDGAYLLAKCTTASCKLSTAETGGTGGYMRITVILKRAASYSNIYE